MTILIVLMSLLLASVVVLVIFTILLYNRIITLLTVNGGYQADEYRKAVQIQKTKKESLPAVKEEFRGRKIVKSDELVDIDSLDWEAGAKAIEEFGNGPS